MADRGSVAAELERLDVSSCDAAQVADALVLAVEQRGWLDGLCARLSARADALAADGHGPGGAEVVRVAGRWSARDARQVADRGRVIDALPQVGAELEVGSISASHVDVIARTARRLDGEAQARFLADSDLLGMAQMVAPEVFERHCVAAARQATVDDGVCEFERQRRATRLRRWVNQATGMYVLNGEFDPETGAKVFTALDREIEARRHAAPDGTTPPEGIGLRERMAAQALAGLVTGSRQSAASGPAEVIVLIDLDSLTSGPHADTLAEFSDGTALPVATVRRLACEAELIPAVLDGDGQVLDVGDGARLATWAQRRALRAMYASCFRPGCDVPFDQCEIHHLHPWEHGGPTDLVNLRPLCAADHHKVHEGGWKLTVDDDGTVSWWRPDGVLHSSAPFEPLQPRKRRRRP